VIGVTVVVDVVAVVVAVAAQCGTVDFYIATCQAWLHLFDVNSAWEATKPSSSDKPNIFDYFNQLQKL
jgi:hypothetical protein